MPPKRCPKCNKYMKANVVCVVCGFDVNAEKPTEEKKPTTTKKGTKKTTTKKK